MIGGLFFSNKYQELVLHKMKIIRDAIGSQCLGDSGFNRFFFGVIHSCCRRACAHETTDALTNASIQEGTCN